MIPAPVSDVARLMAGFGRTWALCGGWAVDAWLGRQTRGHIDVDVAISNDDQLALHGYLRDGWLLNGHDPNDDDSTHPWDGHRLEVPAHIHARGHGLELDFQLEDRQGDAWLLRREPRLAVPIARCVTASTWAVPTLAPEVALFYKSASAIREHDAADFEALLPLLDDDQRAWLRDAIGAIGPDHPWLPRLA